MQIDEKVLEYMEAQTAKLSAFRLESMELLNKRANVLITLQLASGGGLAAFAVNLIEKDLAPEVVVRGVIYAAIGMFMLALASAVSLMLTRKILPPGNEPNNLFMDAKAKPDLLALRASELRFLQERQDGWRLRNEDVGRRLNFLYFYTAILPFLASGLASLGR